MFVHIQAATATTVVVTAWPNLDTLLLFGLVVMFVQDILGKILVSTKM